MPVVKLPINQGMVKATDEVGLVTHGAAMMDCYIDILGNINRRPGLVELCDLGASPVDGLYWWSEQAWVIAVSGGNTYKITDAAGTKAQITHDDTDWVSGARPTFAHFSTDVYGANGGKIKTIPSSGNVTDIADADAPTVVTHVAFLDRYLLANEDGTGNFHWSDVNAPTAWGANYAEAEAKRDDLTAMLVENLEVHLLGKKTLEIWHDDGSTPFIRLLQGYVPSGTISPDSFAWCNAIKTFCWLDERRHVVKLEGRTPVPLSLTMSKYIQGFTSVSDAIGDSIEAAGRPYYMLHFPAEDKTLVYDFLSTNWYEWGFWDSGGAVYERWRGNCHCIAPSWNLSLVGDKANGKVYKFDTTAYDDDGSTLRTMIRTAHYNHGTELKRKFSNSLTFRLKRTNVVSLDATPDLLIKMRDDGATTWQNEYTVSLQQVGETEFRGFLPRLGSYYSRQYQIVLSDAFPLCLVSVEEDVDIDS